MVQTTRFYGDPAGKRASGIRFNIRPRSRPRWYRGPDDRETDGRVESSDPRDPRREGKGGRGGRQGSRGGQGLGRGREARGGPGRGFREPFRAAATDPGYYGRGGRGDARQFRGTVPGGDRRKVVLRPYHMTSETRKRSRSRSRSSSRSGSGSGSSATSDSSGDRSNSRSSSYTRCAPT